MIKESIIDKIKKLDALSTSSNEHEAALAATKVQELLYLCNLTLEEVRNVPEKSEYIKAEERLDCNRLSRGWMMYLYHAVAETNLCHIVAIPKSNRIYVLGKRHNLQVVHYLYMFLEREIRRLSEDAATREQMLCSEVSRAAYIRLFSLGAVNTIYRRLKEARDALQENNTDCRSLVVKNDKELARITKEHFPKTRKTGASYKSNNGYEHGSKRAESIPLKSGIHGNSQPLLF